MIRYSGLRLARGCRVWILSDSGPLRPLPSRIDLYPQGRGEFNWGQGCAEAQQLAVALLAHAIGDEQAALTLSCAYVTQVLSRLDCDSWDIYQADICAWATAHSPAGVVYTPGVIIV